MIKTCLAATAVLLASAGAASSQSLIECLDPTGLTCGGGFGSGGSLGTSGSGSGSSLRGPATSGARTNLGTAGITATITPPTLGGTITFSPGTFQNQDTTSAIPQPPTAQGMPALVIPNDPFGISVGQSPFTGSSSIGAFQNSFGNGGIRATGIR
ncbi:hypothetical protein SAZ10_00265 [Mesorhizobium sp. BAC0120]|uniref:hypothetical protein n=1 Tax=Mesorhizobium sp. BAC0120 TaxID=3090670 RepID=UPI00298D3F1A|nr:hypothetical protein [Mesorhizobium sp. BAC0120]MDW6020189.1 hypothetical protein [Mesorhizobium sp. BAC0120]